ncbi:5'-nucleotidase C-terminal domain-containing protein [Lacinutrix salivirga]
MNFRPLILILIFITSYSCKKENYQITKIEGKRIPIKDTIALNAEIDAFIKPYREHVNNDLDSVLAYSIDTYSKTDGEFNTAIGNLFADVVLEQSNPVFNTRTGKTIDAVLLNHGGIRAIISKGNITSRTAYEIMPFENSIVIVALKGEQINKMTEYLSKAKRAHPIQGLQLTLNKDYSINKATINNKPIEKDKTYYVATNDYLYSGGDRMTFFQTNDTVYDLNYKIRNAFIDYFKKVDTIAPEIDNRFIKLN